MQNCSGYCEQLFRVNFSIDYYVAFLCIDADGHIDVIELKDSKKDLLRKTLYRNNYVPSGELSSSIVQIEHYIYQLCTKLKENEEFLNEKHAKTITQIYFFL